MSIDLKPCPFCGSANVEYVPEAADDPSRFPGVHCMDCSAEGSTGADEATCIAAWNRRSPTDNLEAGAGDLVPVAWFIAPDDDGVYQQVAKQHYGEPDLVPLYSAAQLAAVTAENARLRETLEFVWRWTWYKEGNGTSDAERLSAIKHHPGIAFLSQEAPK